MDTERIESLKAWADQLWIGMMSQGDKTWTRKRTADYLNGMFACWSPVNNEVRWVLERVLAEHPDELVKVAGQTMTFQVVIQDPGLFQACRSTQHCAYHGWCQRCAPQFAVVMNDVNRAIADGGATDSQRGPLYHEVGKALMPYLLHKPEDRT